MAIIYIILLVLGFLPFLIVLYKVKKANKIKREGIKTTGIVRGMSGSHSSKLSSLVIDYYINETNQWVRKNLIVSGRPYEVGQELPLYYDRKDPNKMAVGEGKGHIVMIVLTLLLAAFVVAACFLINRDLANATF
jgi:Protein of unknown function (DUF3592)